VIDICLNKLPNYYYNITSENIVVYIFDAMKNSCILIMFSVMENTYKSNPTYGQLDWTSDLSPL